MFIMQKQLWIPVYWLGVLMSPLNIPVTLCNTISGLRGDKVGGRNEAVFKVNATPGVIPLHL